MPTTQTIPRRIPRSTIDALRVTAGTATAVIAAAGALATHNNLVEAALIGLTAVTALAIGTGIAPTTTQTTPSTPTNALEALAVLGTVNRAVDDMSRQMTRIAKLQHANLEATRGLAAGYEEGAPGDTNQHPLPKRDDKGTA